MSRRRAFGNGPFGGSAPAPDLSAETFLVRSSSSSLSGERVVTDTATVTWDWGTAGQAKANVSGFAPASPTYLVTAASGDLSAERVIADEYGLLYIDGGHGSTYQPLRFGSHWEYEYNPQAGVMTMVGGGNDSGVLTPVSDAYVLLAGAGAQISSTNNAVWLGVNAASDKGGFIQAMRGIIVITTLAAVDELRGFFGCWSAALSGVGDSPSNGDGWAVSVRDSDLELVSRDGTTLSGRTKIADLSANTSYWVEYHYQPGVAINARVHTVSAGVVTSGAWVAHSSNLPRTNLAWSVIGCWAPTAANSRGLIWHRTVGYDVAT